MKTYLIKILFICSFVPTLLIQNFNFVSRLSYVEDTAIRTYIFNGNSGNKSISKKVDTAKKVLNYVKGRKPLSEIKNISLDYDKFSRSEIGHLRDVKKVFIGITYSGYAFLVALLVSVILLLKFDRKNTISVIFTSSSVLFGILFFLAIFMYFNFNYFFSLLHAPFFKSGSWLFDESSLIINLFPVEFWMNIIKNYFLYIICETIFTAGITYYLSNKFRSRFSE